MTHQSTPMINPIMSRLYQSGFFFFGGGFFLGCLLFSSNPSASSCNIALSFALSFLVLAFFAMNFTLFPGSVCFHLAGIRAVSSPLFRVSCRVITASPGTYLLIITGISTFCPSFIISLASAMRMIAFLPPIQYSPTPNAFLLVGVRF